MEFILNEKANGSGFERFVYVSNKPRLELDILQKLFYLYKRD